MTPKKLSVIIPCYRVERYLRRCLDALLAQEFDGIELVCINDGSPDGCPAILREYEGKYGDRIVVIDQDNAGVWKARIRGIAAASGEYIGFADPDDTVRPGYASRMYEAAKTRNSDIVCCGFERVDEDTGKKYSMEMTRFPYDSFDIQEEPGLMPEVNPALWNKIYRAEVLRKIPEFTHIPKVLDDMVFSQLIYMNARTISFLREPLILYRIRKDSIIGNLKPEDLPGVYTAMEEVGGLYAQTCPELLTALDATAFLHLGISMMHRVSVHGKDALQKALQETMTFLDGAFPTWRRNPYLRLRYVLWHHGANRKLRMVRQIYRMHLAVPFLRAYGEVIRRTEVQLKW